MCLFVCMSNTCVRCLQWLEEVIVAIELALQGVVSHFWGLNLGPLQEKQAFLATKPSLQTWNDNLIYAPFHV